MLNRTFDSHVVGFGYIVLNLTCKLRRHLPLYLVTRWNDKSVWLRSASEAAPCFIVVSKFENETSYLAVDRQTPLCLHLYNLSGTSKTCFFFPTFFVFMNTTHSLKYDFCGSLYFCLFSLFLCFLFAILRALYLF